MAFYGPFVGYLLRVITPEEINELTTTLDGGKKQSLTMLLEKRDPDISVEESDEKEEGPQVKIGDDVSKLLLQKLPLLSVDSFADIKLLKEDPFVAERIKKSYKNSKQIISSYQKSAEISVKKDDKEELDKHIQYGILVNKKQF